MADRETKIQRLKRELAERTNRLRTLRKENLSCFFKPFASIRREMPYQQMVLDHFHNGKNIVVFPAPNKVGKTGMSANIIGSWCLGYEPWNPVKETHEKATLVGDEWYHASSLGKSPPVRIRITGEDWTHSVGQTIVPELKKWIPAKSYETRKNSQGVEYFWKFRNGSTIEIMTHDQDPKLFESWLGDAWWPDEPPPYAIWSAMSRGLFMTNGKVLIPTTPLREAWMLDELVLSDRPDIAVIEDVNLWDNPMLYQHDLDVLEGAALSKAEIEQFFLVQMEFGDAAGLLKKMLKERHGEEKGDVMWGDCMQDMQIERFIQDIPEDERMPRLYGRFKSLQGRVYKDYSPDIHIIESFEVPADWPVFFQIDFHLSKPQAVAYYTVDKQDTMYVIREVWLNMSDEELADEVIRSKRKFGWRLERGEIDPLAKGDTKYLRNSIGNKTDAFTTIKQKLAPHGILFEVASKDKVSGIKNMQSRLKGPNGRPTYYVFKDCVRHKHEFLRFVYDEDGIPKKENDDMMECGYRATLMGVVYTDLSDVKRKIDYDNMKLGII
jgi:hypothetical protein